MRSGSNLDGDFSIVYFLLFTEEKRRIKTNINGTVRMGEEQMILPDRFAQVGWCVYLVISSDVSGFWLSDVALGVVEFLD